MLNQISKIILIFGGLLIGSSTTQYNFTKHIPKEYLKIFFLTMSVASIYLAYHMYQNPHKDYFPCPILGDNFPTNAKQTYKLKTVPHARIIYWGTNQQTKKILQNVKQAYGNYENSGVVTADKNGVAILKFNYPQEYYKPGLLWNSNKSRHLHYRICHDNKISEVKNIVL